MGARFFLGNFDFEHRLANPHHEPSDKLKRLNAELAAAWLCIAKDGDWIWTPLPISQAFFCAAERDGFPQVIPVRSLHDVPHGIECVPWGWSDEVKRMAQQFGWQVETPSDAAIRYANSRATSYELETRWGIGLKGARCIRELGELDSAIRSLKSIDDRWVVKAEFGMSGRERILGRGPLRFAETNWVERRLTMSGSVFFEPWVQRIDEIGIQIEIPEFGEPHLLGLSKMMVDERGQYAGSRVEFEEINDGDRSTWAEAINNAIRVADHLKANSYFGPMGIDAMRYRDVDGIIRIRSIQDINARWTMGRLSLGLRSMLQQDEFGIWSHGSEEIGIDLNPIAPVRVIETSPSSIGGIRCQHRSRFLILKQYSELSCPDNAR